ncbi:hypothetical protein OWC48_46640, partial [Bradyrhizobium sp. Arg816]|nr:hypothetical protein [Bradyrhizobium sp. Arg816]
CNGLFIKKVLLKAIIFCVYHGVFYLKNGEILLSSLVWFLFSIYKQLINCLAIVKWLILSCIYNSHKRLRK